MNVTNSKIIENLRKRPKKHAKYRTSQAKKGLVRFEFQINAETKNRFEQLVKTVADEYTTPWDERQRLAKARAQVFDEITKNIQHEFFTLQEQINALKAEIKVLSPSFFITDTADKTPLPEAINALPDDPLQLKQLLAKTYLQTQQLKVSCAEYKRQADQFEKLYEAVSNTNEDLTRELKQKVLNEN